MSLLDALLLDAQRINIWFAVRTDANRGCGTQTDPYNSETFDEIMAGLPSTPPVCVHLGPGEFQTQGYYEGMSGGWQPHPGMKIRGSGIDVTTLKMTGAQDPTSGTRHYWAIGHDLGAGGTLMDYFEVSDLTVNCDLTNQGTSAIAIGGVRVLGNYAKVRRVKVVDWGTKSSTLTCWVLAVITADAALTTEQTAGMSIEECVAIDPFPDLAPLPTNPGRVSVLYAGLKGDPGTGLEGEASGPVIRNCYVDCGTLTSPLNYDIRGIAMAACKGGVVEGNEIHHVRTGGPYAEKSTVSSLVARNNSYHDVRIGVCLKEGQKAGGTPVSISSLTFESKDGGYDATAQTGGSHNLKAGDRVELNCSPGSLSGLFFVTERLSETQFKYFTAGPSGTLSSGTMERVFGTGKVVIEGNTFELANDSDGDVAIELDDDDFTSQLPDHIHGEVVIRANRISYVDEVFDSGYTGTGLRVRGAKHLRVQDNMVDVQPEDPLQDLRSGSAVYFKNERPDGTLVRGYKDDTEQQYDELETEAEDALVLALFNRR